MKEIGVVDFKQNLNYLVFFIPEYTIAKMQFSIIDSYGKQYCYQIYYSNYWHLEHTSQGEIINDLVFESFRLAIKTAVKMAKRKYLPGDVYSYSETKLQGNCMRTIVYILSEQQLIKIINNRIKEIES